MKKRLLCALLAAVILIGIVALAPFEVKAASNMTASQELIELIKQFEGFIQYPIWDYKQYSMGYGTVCEEHELAYYEANGITKEEAEERLRKHVDAFGAVINSFIDTYGITMTQQQFDAMVSLSYNCGAKWATETAGYLHNALRSGATGNDLLYAFSLWSYTNNYPNKGLIARRLKEANMYLNGVYSNSMPASYTYVLFDPNGGTADYLVQGYDADVDTPIRIQIDQTYTVANTDGTSEIYTFDGWYTAKSGGTKVEVLDGSLSIGSMLYARWKASDGVVIEPPPPETTPIDGVKVTVKGSGVNVRSGPGTDYGIVGEVDKNAVLTITETCQNGGYLWGKFGENQWIALSYTNYDSVINGKNETDGDTDGNTGNTGNEGNSQPQRPVQTVTGTVTVSDYLNIRSDAGTSYPKVGEYSGGTKITILEQRTVGATVWGRTDKGWISMDYVKLDTENSGETTQPPATEPPVTEPPVTQPPVTKPPVTEPPVTVPPVTEPPVTEPPVSEPGFKQWTGTVKVSDTLYVRSGAGTYHSITGYLTNGTQVTILEEKTVDGMRWGRVERGWISLRYVTTGTGTDTGNQGPSEPDNSQTTTPVTPEIPVATGKWTGVVNVKDILYIRGEAGVAGEIKGNLVNGTKVTITQKKTVDGKEWGRVAKGWICLDYVVLGGENNTTPQPDNENTPTPDNNTNAEKPNNSSSETGSSTVLEEPITLTVNTCSLRIRGGAGVTNSIIGYLLLGDEVTITETWVVGTTVWGKTDAGWVSQKYLK